MKAMRTNRLIATICLTFLVLTACGSDAATDLTPQAAEGRQVAQDAGCTACHGKDGQGATGPAWQGLYLSTVDLNGGVSVVADDEYLYRSITDPQAEIVRNLTIKMPANNLNDTQVAAIIAYIKELQ